MENNQSPTSREHLLLGKIKSIKIKEKDIGPTDDLSLQIRGIHSSGCLSCDEFQLFATMVTIGINPHSIYTNRENNKSSIISQQYSVWGSICACMSL